MDAARRTAGKRPTREIDRPAGNLPADATAVARSQARARDSQSLSSGADDRGNDRSRRRSDDTRVLTLFRAGHQGGRHARRHRRARRPALCDPCKRVCAGAERPDHRTRQSADGPLSAHDGANHREAHTRALFGARRGAQGLAAGPDRSDHRAKHCPSRRDRAARGAQPAAHPRQDRRGDRLARSRADPEAESGGDRDRRRSAAQSPSARSGSANTSTARPQAPRTRSTPSAICRPYTWSPMSARSMRQ